MPQCARSSPAAAPRSRRAAAPAAAARTRRCRTFGFSTPWFARHRAEPRGWPLPHRVRRQDHARTVSCPSWLPAEQGSAGFTSRNTASAVASGDRHRESEPILRLCAEARAPEPPFGRLLAPERGFGPVYAFTTCSSGEAAAGADIAGVDDQRAVLDQQPVIDRVVIGADDRGVEAGERRRRSAGPSVGRRIAGCSRVGGISSRNGSWNDTSAPRFSSSSMIVKRRAFAGVVDILLVGDADDQDARALQRAAGALVQRLDRSCRRRAAASRC